ncbi:putative disease resistance protein [Trifolium medium]|uniref:Putative disease resistance protein n=1 Tax=Trifolium medium TaxID=97028 RepID=A0A392NBE8_9FABA|nr:putative disease resistance protein [Trifolium medium]
MHRPRHLESLDISNCSSLRNAFPACIAEDLIHLKHLRITCCGEMREIIGGNEQHQQKEITHHDDGIIVFPELKELKLVRLKNLTSFCCYQSGESDTYYKVHNDYSEDVCVKLERAAEETPTE